MPRTAVTVPAPPPALLSWPQALEGMGGPASASVLRPVQAAMRMAERGDTKALRHLLHAAPQLVCAVNSKGRNAAHLAARAGAVAAVEVLLQAVPALFRVMDRRGRLPSHLTDPSRNGLVRAPRAPAQRRGQRPRRAEGGCRLPRPADAVAARD
jgi:hypothetical protein